MELLIDYHCRECSTEAEQLSVRGGLVTCPACGTRNDVWLPGEPTPPRHLLLYALSRAKQRIRAILCCLYYGLLPWWCYEAAPHYTCSWVEHFCINLGYALRWAFFLETADDWAFEARVNPRLPPPMRRFLLLLVLLPLPAALGAPAHPTARVAHAPAPSLPPLFGKP